MVQKNRSRHSVLYPLLSQIYFKLSFSGENCQEYQFYEIAGWKKLLISRLRVGGYSITKGAVALQYFPSRGRNKERSNIQQVTSTSKPIIESTESSSEVFDWQLSRFLTERTDEIRKINEPFAFSAYQETYKRIKQVIVQNESLMTSKAKICQFRL